MAPSAPPAPITVWISSINKRTSPHSVVSRIARLIRSSNSPRYLEPATMPDRSSVRTRLSASVPGTSPSTIRCASPSAMAVLPTPGSPMRHGLFLVRLLRISITESISSSRFKTGSNFPSLAYSLRFLVYCFSIGVLLFLLRFFPRLATSSFLAETASPPSVTTISVKIFCTLAFNLVSR